MQSREQAERAAKKKQEAFLVRLGKMLDRLEASLDKLENISQGLNYNAVLQEALDRLKQALPRGRNISWLVRGSK